MKRRIEQISTTQETAELFKIEAAVSADGQDARVLFRISDGMKSRRVVNKINQDLCVETGQVKESITNLSLETSIDVTQEFTGSFSTEAYRQTPNKK